MSPSSWTRANRARLLSSRSPGRRHRRGRAPDARPSGPTPARGCAKGHAITDTAKVPPKPDGQKPNCWPLVNDELAINCGKAQAEGVELLSPSGGVSKVTRAVWNGPGSGDDRPPRLGETRPDRPRQRPRLLAKHLVISTRRSTRSPHSTPAAGYFIEQATRPQTIGYDLLDSPVALAAWMIDHDTDSYEKISRALSAGGLRGISPETGPLDDITLQHTCAKARPW